MAVLNLQDIEVTCWVPPTVFQRGRQWVTALIALDVIQMCCKEEALLVACCSCTGHGRA